MKIFIPLAFAGLLMACNFKNAVPPQVPVTAVKDTIKAFLQEMESDDYVSSTRYPADSTFGRCFCLASFMAMKY